jgi:hypothetical protein
MEAYSTIQFQPSGADVDIKLQQTSAVTSQIRTGHRKFFGSASSNRTGGIPFGAIVETLE